MLLVGFRFFMVFFSMVFGKVFILMFIDCFGCICVSCVLWKLVVM